MFILTNFKGKTALLSNIFCIFFNMRFFFVFNHQIIVRLITAINIRVIDNQRFYKTWIWYNECLTKS